MNTIYGQCVQPGIAIGRVRRWGKRSPAAERREIADTDAELARLRHIYERASRPARLEPLDWMHTACPGEYLDCGERISYDWFSNTAGARVFFA